MVDLRFKWDKAWGLIVNDTSRSCKTFMVVDSRDNFMDFSTNIPNKNPLACLVIPHIPRLMKNRTV